MNTRSVLGEAGSAGAGNKRGKYGSGHHRACFILIGYRGDARIVAGDIEVVEETEHDNTSSCKAAV
ncbi:MAG: hypothetical protein SGI77_19700 [Pirellulaceae bacterium]|nr:hypothetical protein [Pirellulaceae bacterium]